MKQQNFLFVDLISSIFLLVLLIGNFMGLLYITDGSLVISILGSLFLVVCYFFVVQLLKKNKEVMFRNKFLHGSLLFWAFFLFLGFISFNLMSHFINIEYNCKEKIKTEATTKIRLVENMAAVYKKRAKDDVLDYEAKLKTKLTQYKATKNNALRNELAVEPYKVDARVLNDPAYIDVNQVANAKVAPYQLKIENNITNIEKTISLNSKKYQSVFDNWKRLSLVATYSKLNEYVEANIKLINSKIEELPLDKTLLNVSYNKKQLPLNSPSKLNKLFPPDLALPLAIIIVIHIFILIPFLSHKVRGYRNSASRSSGPISNGGNQLRGGHIEL
ncbi:hypothetical protein SAMN05443667_11922 [Flavobacterium gillisiae]|uniref:Uncharacterized protein n=1 Tax=Flavobacterium gillisiae TaxID=150146 RepID=A0A1H4GAI2_9FLAO|nr:hypothetical protein [Flavobacterium gillisiae]SEB06564.1 hypothetical protein SAMN05443667_11922 [Flavobacterium gillisiae]